MKIAARAVLAAAALVLPGTAFAADLSEYQAYVCEPLTPESQPYTIQCPLVNGEFIEEMCVCKDTIEVVTIPPPKNVSPQ